MAGVASAVKECSVTTRGHSTVLDTDPRATRTLTIGPRALCSLVTISKSLLLAFLLPLTSGCWWDFFPLVRSSVYSHSEVISTRLEVSSTY